MGIRSRDLMYKQMCA